MVILRVALGNPPIESTARLISSSAILFSTRLTCIPTGTGSSLGRPPHPKKIIEARRSHAIHQADPHAQVADWATLSSDISHPFSKPKRGRIAIKVINHLGDEVMKVFKVPSRPILRSLVIYTDFL